LADEITETIPTSLYKNMMKNLMDSGYTIEVTDDEIQAYMMSNWDYTNFSKKINKKECNKLSKLYKQTLESFLK
jgi:TPP-dependent 2-oxoacid decarboxylase